MLERRDKWVIGVVLLAVVVLLLVNASIPTYIVTSSQPAHARAPRLANAGHRAGDIPAG